MKNFINSNKKTIIWIIVILLLVLGYLIFFKSPSEPESGITRVTAQGASVSVGSEILKNLNKIKILNLKKDIYTDPVFLNLQDFSRPIPSQIKGKNSPFDPIGIGRTSQGGSVNNNSTSTDDN